MKTKHLEESSQDSSISRVAGPRMVVAYEDSETAAKLREILRRISPDAGQTPGPAASLWKFDLLNYPALLEQAIAEVRDAELTILSMHGDCELPEAAARCIERGIWEKTNREDRLVVIFDEAAEFTESADHILDHLKNIANQAQLKIGVIFSNAGPTLEMLL